MNLVTKGLVIRETDYKDSDRIVTLLTEERGRISANCRHARQGNSALKAGTQLLTCSEFSLFERNGKYTVDAAEPVELFLGLRKSVEALALASYFAEVLGWMAPEESPCGALLSDTLNLLYALAKELRPRAQIKAAFELRIAAMGGWMPDLTACASCGETEPERVWLSVSGGDMICAGCADEAGVQVFTAGYAELNRGALMAARYLLSAPSKRMLSFTIDAESLALLSAASERYLLRQLDRRFETLNFYRSVEADALN